MHQPIRPRRSVLYMPGSNARALEKARSIPVDALILDLEDAVAPDQKAMARIQVAEAVKSGGYGGREVIIRINALDTPWGAHDLNTAVNAHPDAILVPKVEKATDLREVALKVRAGGHAIAIWAMVETPLALLRIGEIAACAANPEIPLAAFVMGTNDLAKETRARFVAGRAPMLPWLTTSILAARAYGIDIIDGVYNDFRDEAGFRAECEQGRDLGMDGKTLIHPDQVGIANETFAPSAEEVERARSIIAAFALPENAGKGAISVDGRMVELLHAEMARRTVALAEAIRKLESAA